MANIPNNGIMTSRVSQFARVATLSTSWVCTEPVRSATIRRTTSNPPYLFQGNFGSTNMTGIIMSAILQLLLHA
jgi:hypothetical protein